MKCLFTIGMTAKNNEEYKAIIKRRMRYKVCILILGLLTMGFAIAAACGAITMLSEYMNGVYTGIGSGCIAVSIIMLIRDYKLLHDEEKLKQDRLKNTDERNVMIYNKAMQYAGSITLICAYIVMLIAGMYSEVIFHCFYAVVAVFMFVYLLMIAILNKKM